MGYIWGLVNFFDPFSLVHNEEPIRNVPADFYMTGWYWTKSGEMRGFIARSVVGGVCMQLLKEK